MKNVFERVSVSRAPMALRGILLAVACIAADSVAAQGLSPYDDINAPENSTRLMPQAARGSEYPTHGDRQAGHQRHPDWIQCWSRRLCSCYAGRALG